MKNKYFLRNLLKFVCAALALAICAAGFTSCFGNGGETPVTTAEPSDSSGVTTGGGSGNGAPADENALQLISEGRSNVRIVYQTQGGAIYAMEAIRNALVDLVGVKVSAVPDIATEQNADALEIIIGNTRYAASEEAIRDLEPNSYSISVSGKKIVVAANNVCLYQTAGEALVRAFTVQNGTVTLAKDYEEKSESYPVLTLASNLKSAYTIVYPNGDEDAQTQANALKNVFQSVGIAVSVTSDSASAGGKEILVGKTNRSLSANDPSYYLNVYTGCDANGNLAVLGNLSAGVAMLKQYVEDIALVSRDVEIPQFLFGFSTPKGYGNAPEYKGSGTVKLVENFEKFNSYYIQAWGAKEKDYDDYAKLLKAAGFRLYDSNRTHDSLFSTYTDGYTIINLSYLEYATPVAVNGAKAGDTVTYVNIAVESTDSSALPPLESDEPAITTVQLTMLNSEPAFLIRMRDGRFIFVDGGVDDNYGRVNADLFFEQLSAQNVREGKPVVAAWIITHPHADHVAGVMRTIQKYGDRFETERVLCNFQSEATVSASLGGTMETEGPYNYSWQMSFYNEIISKYPKIQLHTVHAGQRFVFTGLEIEVLWTPENLCQSFKVGNEASVIYKLTGDEGSFLVTGDAQPINCQLTDAIWGEDAESDLLNYAHHGYRGGDVHFYATVNARYGIWTNCWEEVLKNSSMRNNPSYNGVDPKAATKILIPTNEEPVLILYPGMPESALEPYVRNQQLLGK